MARRQQDVFSRHRGHYLRWIALVLVFSLGGFGVYIALDNGRVAVRTQKVLVANLPEELEGFTILHISDLNGKRFGPKQKQIEDALKNKKYNAVCMTGDMVGKRGDYYPLYELLALLDASKPVFFIPGDMDPSVVADGGNGSSVLSEWVLSAQTRGATLLDAPASMTVGKSTVWFSDAAQIPLDLQKAASAYAAAGTRQSAYYLDTIQRTIAARERMRYGGLHIALSHKPLKADVVQSMQRAEDQNGNSVLRSIDLVLAGDLCGGQWQLPLIGSVWAEKWFPSGQVQGYGRTGTLVQYISGGLDVSGASPLPGFRMLNTPEITLITFTSVMDADVAL